MTNNPATQQDLSDTQSSLSEGQPANNEVIFLQDIPETPQSSILKSVINYAMVLILLMSFCYGALGAAFIHVHQSSIPNLSWPILALFALYSCQLIVEGFAMFFNKSMYIAHLGAFLDAIGTLIILAAFYGYLNVLLSGQVFLNLLIVNIIFQFIKYWLKSGKAASPVNLIVSLIQAVSVLLIGLKLIEPHSNWSWSLVLTYYTCVYYIGMFLVGALTIGIVVLFLLFIGRASVITNMPGVYIALLFPFLLMLTFATAAGCLAYRALRSMLEADQIKPMAGSKGELPIELLWAGYAMQIGAAFCLLFGIMLACFRQRLIRAFLKIPLKQVSLRRYYEAFQLKLKAISGRVFQRNGSSNGNDKAGSDEKITQDPIPMDSCVICQTQASCFLFTPCNHSLVCADCVGVFVRTADKCPVCSTKLKAGYHIRFSETLGNYVVDQSYQIQTS